MACCSTSVTMQSASLPFSGGSSLFWRSDGTQLAFYGFQRSNKHIPHINASANVSGGKGTKANDVIMVDPLEAKRLAAKQMQEIKAKEKRKRQRQIEAINGAWAIIGLTAGLVIEGKTGDGILAQVMGYLEAIKHLFIR